MISALICAKLCGNSFLIFFVARLSFLCSSRKFASGSLRSIFAPFSASALTNNPNRFEHDLFKASNSEFAQPHALTCPLRAMLENQVVVSSCLNFEPICQWPTLVLQKLQRSPFDRSSPSRKRSRSRERQERNRDRRRQVAIRFFHTVIDISLFRLVVECFYP